MKIRATLSSKSLRPGDMVRLDRGGSLTDGPLRKVFEVQGERDWHPREPRPMTGEECVVCFTDGYILCTPATLWEVY